MKYTRKDIIKVLTATGVDYYTAQKHIAIIIDGISAALAAGNVIELRGLGTFEQRTYKPRTRMNPKTLQPVHVPARRSVFFRPGQELKRELRGKRNNE